MREDAWSLKHPAARAASLLGEQHAAYSALTRVQFFDAFDLDIGDCREGYSATALYHEYLRSRLRVRVQSAAHIQDSA